MVIANEELGTGNTFDTFLCNFFFRGPRLHNLIYREMYRKLEN